MIHQVVAAISAIRKAGKRKDGGRSKEELNRKDREKGDKR